MTRLILAGLLLALAACGDSADPPVANQPSSADEIAITETESTPAGTPPAGQARATDSPAPVPAPIPAKFRGTWAESKALCADVGHHSRVTISDRPIRHPEFVMVGDSVTASGSQFALKGRFEGTGRPAEAQYFINEVGDVMTDGGGGGAVRVRCA